MNNVNKKIESKRIFMENQKIKTAIVDAKSRYSILDK